ncbi:hypothetical protein [Candidatus Enterococcus clewellii]|uniref:Uncharacterized protein n=1 Tax=Candidatus Enterococcus clewellii TaxID=1834193 RepID=A0A242K4V0_9ENTE|nr:hypothetical protein [Enterococcus sp. 9E7_DIV0242]OTP13404.1 hypothetical protein A5888_002882 [Enterococcus sp. 9E7_DIV0242]
MKKLLLFLSVPLFFGTGCQNNKEADHQEENTSSSSITTTIKQTNIDVSVPDYRNGGSFETDSKGDFKFSGSTDPNTIIYVFVQDQNSDNSTNSWIKSGEKGEFEYEFTGLSYGDSVKISLITDVNIDKEGNATVKPNPKISYELIAFRKEEKTADSSQSSKNNDRTNYFELDKIVNDIQPGSQTMSYEDFEGLVIQKATLEGLIAKFGLPSHVIGADEGDTTMQVCFPTTENDYSADLTFEHQSGNGFGSWILSKKDAVATDGIGFDKYIAE